MYPTLAPVGKPSIWHHKKKSKSDLFHELSEREKQIEETKAREVEVRLSLRDHHNQEEEEEEEEEGEEEAEEEEVEEAEVPEDLYNSILSESVEMEDASLSYMYGSMQNDDDDEEDDDDDIAY